MIDGKLEEMEREPRNVQVVLVELEQGTVISLRDEGDVFLEVPPSEEPPPLETGGERGDAHEAREEEEESQETQLLHALAEMEERNAELEAQASRLKEEVEKGKTRLKELWRMNCDQLGEHDAAMALKEEEVARLSAQVAGLEVRDDASTLCYTEEGQHIWTWATLAQLPDTLQP